MWVRLPPEVPIDNISERVRSPPLVPNHVGMAERPNATVCKTVKPWVRIPLPTPMYAGLIQW